MSHNLQSDVVMLFNKSGETLEFYLNKSKEIGLKYGQKVKIKKLYLNMLKVEILSEAKIRIAMLELEELFDTGQSNIVSINANIETVTELKNKISRSVIFSTLKARNLLTHDQRKKVLILIKTRFIAEAKKEPIQNNDATGSAPEKSENIPNMMLSGKNKVKNASIPGIKINKSLLTEADVSTSEKDSSQEKASYVNDKKTSILDVYKTLLRSNHKENNVSSESSGSEALSVEVVPSESSGSEALSVEVVPSESSDSDVLSVEVVPSESSGSDVLSVEVAPSESSDSDVLSVEVVPPESLASKPDKTSPVVSTEHDKVLIKEGLSKQSGGVEFDVPPEAKKTIEALKKKIEEIKQAKKEGRVSKKISILERLKRLHDARKGQEKAKDPKNANSEESKKVLVPPVKEKKSTENIKPETENIKPSVKKEPIINKTLQNNKQKIKPKVLAKPRSENVFDTENFLKMMDMGVNKRGFK